MLGKRISLLIIPLFLVMLHGQNPRASVFDHFVTRSSDKLMDGDEEYRFISFNVPNLHYIEDQMVFTETNPWRLPNTFEITDALKAIEQIGGRVVRIYTLSVRKQGENKAIPRYILGPGEYNEEAFRVLDRLLQLANRVGIRVIIPFIDNASWWGGIAEFAAFRGKAREDFWSDPQLIKDFKGMISYVINRRNVYTGVRYKGDKAILAWETGNELRSPIAWTRKMTAYIKSLDSNHLVIDGYLTAVLRKESVEDPNTDLLTTHNYTKDERVLLSDIRKSREMSRGKKPYFIGEFGFIDTPIVQKTLDEVIDHGISGALLWSLRFRNRDGGFYWHSEPYGGNLFKAYHWPGFSTGSAYDEINLFKLVRKKAFQIQDKEVPDPVVPEPPVLLPIQDVASISWKGSVGARTYDVERALNPAGPWKIVGKDIIETHVQYRPLFNDLQAVIGKSYYYRVRAKNEAGASKPSNEIGPIYVSYLTLIDEMEDFSQMHARGGNLVIDQNQARKTKEDLYRLKGRKRCYVVYHLPGSILGWKVYTFFPDEIVDPVFSISSDGITFHFVPSQRNIYYTGKGKYGYWKPVLYSVNTIDGKPVYLRIDFGTKMEISRIEIQYGQ